MQSCGVVGRCEPYPKLRPLTAAACARFTGMSPELPALQASTRLYLPYIEHEFVTEEGALQNEKGNGAEEQCSGGSFEVAAVDMDI